MAGWNQTKPLSPNPVNPVNVRKVIRHLTTERTCPHCLQLYTMGINGTVEGCDTCEGIVRFPNGMIDYSASSPEVFIKQEGKS